MRQQSRSGSRYFVMDYRHLKLRRFAAKNHRRPGGALGKSHVEIESGKRLF